jgi:ferredoxin
MRNIIKIIEEKCNGCGKCAKACAEGAIQIINGKAKLVSETYCDGLGACIGHCPQNAIIMEKREAEEFDEEAVKSRMEKEKPKLRLDFACLGMTAKDLRLRKDPAEGKKEEPDETTGESALGNWPVQLKLVPVNAPYFKGADLLLAADCVPFAMRNFHKALLKEKSVIIGCPKLDDANFYIEKLTQILKTNEIKSLTVIHMEVPCCSGLTRIASESFIRAGSKAIFKDVTVSIRGEILEEKTMPE